MRHGPGLELARTEKGMPDVFLAKDLHHLHSTQPWVRSQNINGTLKKSIQVKALTVMAIQLITDSKIKLSQNPADCFQKEVVLPDLSHTQSTFQHLGMLSHGVHCFLLLCFPLVVRRHASKARCVLWSARFQWPGFGTLETGAESLGSL